LSFKYFKDLPDPRQRGKVMYPLDEVLLLCLLAVLAGAETITDIAQFGETKLALLRRFRPFEDGTLAHDHLGDILATLDAEQFQRCFIAWVATQTGTSAEVIAIDGKTLRRFGSKKKDGKAPVNALGGCALILSDAAATSSSRSSPAFPPTLIIFQPSLCSEKYIM
jgi:hypothetical protein